MSRSLDILSEACSELPHSARKMFGGHAFFAPNGGMFAGIVTDDEVIFKLADAQARTELIAMGGHPWIYDGAKKPMTMAQWIVVPENFYDDLELFSAWAARAHRLVPGKVSAARGAKPKAAPKKTAPKKAAPKKTATKKPAAKKRRA